MTDKRSEEIRKVRKLIDEILKRIDDFTFDQIREIEKGFTYGLPVEIIKFYARPEFDFPQMVCIVNELYEGNISLEYLGQLQRYITPQLNHQQIVEILCWLENDLDFGRFVEEFGEDFSKVSFVLIKCARENLICGLTWERVAEFIQLCREKNFIDDSLKIETINSGILAGLSREEIETHVRPYHNWEEINQIIEDLIKKKEGEIYKNIEVSSFIETLKRSRKLDERRLREIKLGFVNGLTLDQVKMYASFEDLDESKMRMIRLHLQAGYSREQIEFLVDCFRKNYLLEKEISLWLRDGLSFELIRSFVEIIEKVISDRKFITSSEISEINEIRKRLRKLPKEQIEFYSEKVQSLIETYKQAGFDLYQIAEIILGYLDGLSEEQISSYAKHKFSGFQMKQIRLAHLDGLTQKEIEFLANPKFNDGQMETIRAGLKYGLSLEQIKKFTKPKYKNSEIERIFLGYLWNLPEKSINFYMNPNLPNIKANKNEDSVGYYMLTDVLRIALLKGFSIPEIEYVAKNSFSETNTDYFTLRTFSKLLDEYLKNREIRAKVRALLELKSKLEKNWEKSFFKKKRQKEKLIL